MMMMDDVIEIGNNSNNGTTNTANIPLTAEIWLHVFSFFLGGEHPMIIDGYSIRSASSVNKAFKDIVESKELWKLPPLSNNIHKDNVMANAGHDDHDDNASSQHAMTTRLGLFPVSNRVVSSSVHRALQIKEAYSVISSSSSSPNENIDYKKRSTLMGFVNEKRLEDGPEKLTFVVRERSSGRRWVLAISEKGHHSDSLLSEIYAGHWKMQDQFLVPPAILETPKDSTRCFDHGYHSDRIIPQGISSWGGRVVRWYGPVSMCAFIDKQQLTIMNVDRSISTMFRQEQEQWRDLRRSSHRPTTKTWVTLIDWMAQICECFDLSDDCLSLATSIFDKYLSLTTLPIRRSKYLQLLSGTCVLLASKCHSNTNMNGNVASAPLLNPRDIALCADNTFSEQEVLLMERSILSHLRWKLAIPTPLDFLNICLNAVAEDCCVPIRAMSVYILEMALQTDIILRYRPSIVAGASIVLAQVSLREKCKGNIRLWPDELERLTSISFEEVAEATLNISRAINHVRLAFPQLSVIKRRYEKLRMNEDGEQSIPVLASIMVLKKYHKEMAAF